MENFSTNLNDDGLQDKDTTHDPNEVFIGTDMLKQVPFFRTGIERVEDDCINEECKHESSFI